MTIEIEAAYVQVTKEKWGNLIIWSVDDNLEAEKYLMLQAAYEYSEQDIRLGMNDIYIECCGQGWSWYGHIEAFRLSRRQVEVQLSPTAAEHMHNDGQVLAHFTVPDDEYQALRSTLRDVFNGRAYYSEA